MGHMSPIYRRSIAAILLIVRRLTVRDSATIAEPILIGTIDLQG